MQLYFTRRYSDNIDTVDFSSPNCRKRGVGYFFRKVCKFIYIGI